MLGSLPKIFTFWKIFRFLRKNFDLWTKFWFSDTILIFKQKFHSLNRNLIFGKISIFEKKMIFLIQFRFLSKKMIFGFLSKLDFWENFDFWAKISIFKQNLWLWPIFRFLTNFDKKIIFFCCWSKCRFFTENNSEFSKTLDFRQKTSIAHVKKDFTE